jgi:hypothetical protein
LLQALRNGTRPQRCRLPQQIRAGTQEVVRGVTVTPKTNEELYETAHKFLSKQGHKISYKFTRPLPGRSPELKFDVDGTEMNPGQLIALAATYSGWKYLKG